MQNPPLHENIVQRFVQIDDHSTVRYNFVQPRGVSMSNLLLAIAVVLSYLIGAIPFAVLVGKGLRGIDVQRTGSGNAGAMNTIRSVGKAAGVLVFVLDGLKGALAMLLGRWLFGPQIAGLCGAIAVAGHCFSPYLLFATRRDYGSGWKRWLRRSGGKGLATGLVILGLIDWRLVLLVLVIFFAGMMILRTDATWPTIIAVAATTPLIWWLTANRTTTLTVLLVSIIVIVKHLPDVREGFYVDQPT